MKVVVITGSAHKKGTTAALTEELIKGAEASGHEVFRFDGAFKKVHPCIGCNHCHTTEDGCVFKDDMQELNPHLLEADAVVFVSPIYYYDMNAQLKAVIDRFFANDGSIHGQKKMAWITAMADDVAESADGANLSFQKIADFLGWEVTGKVNAVACWDVESLMKTDYPKQAFELGKAL